MDGLGPALRISRRLLHQVVLNHQVASLGKLTLSGVARRGKFCRPFPAGDFGQILHFTVLCVVGVALSVFLENGDPVFAVHDEAVGVAPATGQAPAPFEALVVRWICPPAFSILRMRWNGLEKNTEVWLT